MGCWVDLNMRSKSSFPKRGRKNALDYEARFCAPLLKGAPRAAWAAHLFNTINADTALTLRQNKIVNLFLQRGSIEGSYAPSQRPFDC